MKTRRPGTRTILAAYRKTGLRPTRKESSAGSTTACGLGACLSARGISYSDGLTEASDLWGADWVEGFCFGWNDRWDGCFTSGEGRKGFEAGAAAAKAVFDERKI